MKKFTQIFMLIGLMILSLQAFSQVTVGLKAGLNMGKLLQEDADEVYSENYEFQPGFHAGVQAQFFLNDLVALESGLLFESKGVKFDTDEEGDIPTLSPNSVSLYYLTLPVYLRMEGDISDMVAVYGKAGPYVSYGIAGQVEYENSEDVSWGDDPVEDDFKPLDYGASIGAGVEYGSFFLEFSYDVGWANISTFDDNDYLVRTRVARASVGYMFGQ